MGVEVEVGTEEEARAKVRVGVEIGSAEEEGSMLEVRVGAGEEVEKNQ